MENVVSWHGKAPNSSQAEEARSQIHERLRTIENDWGIVNDRISLREAYGIALRELGQVNERVVALDADISKSTYSWLFEKPSRKILQPWIAEQNMVLTAPVWPV